MIDYKETIVPFINKREFLKKEIERNEREYNKRVTEYRIQSVNRVLDFVRREYSAGRECDIDALLCHCQNKLLGNIDGIELELKPKRSADNG